MSGHSKWSTIKHKKEKTDSQRAKIFTKIGREMSVAVRESGTDPTTNSKLRDLIAKAKANNVPNDNIDRIIKKAAGDGDKNNYETVIYEGYGPDGVAVIVDCLTDNRNRTAADIRHYFDKFGGNMGTTGCVSFMFDKKGIIIIEGITDEEKAMEDFINSGADDFEIQDGVAQVYTTVPDFSKAREGIEGFGYTFLSAEISEVPTTYTTLTNSESLIKMGKLLELLEENDDVQNVWHNLENEDDLA